MTDGLHPHMITGQTLVVGLHSVTVGQYQNLNIVNMIHPHWILSYVLQGDVITTTRGETYNAPTGTIMLHPPNIPFCEYTEHAGVHQWFTFDALTTPYLDLFRVYPVSAVVRLRHPDDYTSTFYAMHRLWVHNDAPFRDFRCVSLATTLFVEVLTSWQDDGAIPRPTQWNAPEDRLAHVIDHMRAHLADHLTLQELATQVHLNASYFNRVFSMAYGLPPMHALRMIRLQRARQLLLENEGTTLDEIAAMCGFVDAAHFGRMFRKAYGVSPGQFRKQTHHSTTDYLVSAARQPR